MADILPYLEVERNDASGQMICVEDLKGLTAEEAQSRLQALGFTAQCSGSEETVTGQIPTAGTAIPYGSQVLLYFGQTEEPDLVTVPDFTGMTRQKAYDTAGSLCLYLQSIGNTGSDPNVVVTAQSIEKQTQVPAGTTIRLEFTDIRARD